MVQRYPLHIGVQNFPVGSVIPCGTTPMLLELGRKIRPQVLGDRCPSYPVAAI